MKPANYNFDLINSTTFRRTMTLLQAGTSSSPQNLSGYTAQMEILNVPDGVVLYTLSTTNGGITLGGAGGSIGLYIPASTTSGFEWSSGIYLLTITDAGNTGDVIPVLTGRFRVIDII